MLVLWIVGCGGETDTKPKETPVPVGNVTPVPVGPEATAVDATPGPVTDGGPPLGDGPWTVTVGGKKLGMIATFDDNEKFSDGWRQYVRPDGGTWEWMTAEKTTWWHVEVLTRDAQVDCEGDENKCSYIGVKPIDVAFHPTHADTPLPKGRPIAGDYHAAGKYNVKANIVDPPDKTPDATMYIGEIKNGKVTEVICFPSKFIWASDKTGPAKHEVSLDFSYVDNSSAPTPTCPDGYKVHSYTITVQ